VRGMRKIIEPQLTKQIVRTVPLCFFLLAEERKSWLIDFKGALNKFYITQAHLCLSGLGL